MAYKSGIRILAIDDGPFEKGDKEVLVAGVVGRDGVVEGVISFRADVDGIDATVRLTDAFNSSRFRNQIRLICTHGMVVGGLNVLDIVALHNDLKVPLIAMTRKKPHTGSLKRAIRANGRYYRRKVDLIDAIARSASSARIGGFYTQSIGIGEGELRKFIGPSAELLRLAHIIASGIESGESKGRF